jgi:hypothetical protein
MRWPTERRVSTQKIISVSRCSAKRRRENTETQRKQREERKKIEGDGRDGKAKRP